MADLGNLKYIFQNCKDSLKNTSFDDTNEEYLCQSDREVINFDKFVGDDSKSFDALYFKNNQATDIYCIEFKNEKPSEINKDELDRKFIEGMKFLEECFKKNNLQIKNYSFHFYVITKNIEGLKSRKYRESFEKNPIEYRLEDKKEGSNAKILQLTKIICRCVGSLKDCYQNIFGVKCK